MSTRPPSGESAFAMGTWQRGSQPGGAVASDPTPDTLCFLLLHFYCLTAPCSCYSQT